LLFGASPAIGITDHTWSGDGPWLLSRNATKLGERLSLEKELVTGLLFNEAWNNGIGGLSGFWRVSGLPRYQPRHN
jgi:hypothetical protein